jgi:hypothetical protein
MASTNNFNCASRKWIMKWSKSIYSSLSYYTMLAEQSGLPWEEFIQQGTKQGKTTKLLDTATKNRITNAITHMAQAEIRLLYQCNGLCTAWAVMIANDLEQEEDVKFQFVDSGRHRLAFEEGGIVLDSSARKVLQLENGSCFSIDIEAGSQPAYNVQGLGGAYPGLQYTVLSY